MTQKPLSIIIFLVIATGIILAAFGMRKTENTSPTTSPAANVATGVDTVAASSTSSSSANPPPSIAVGEGLPLYTLADVAKHSSPKDCWTTINGNVYNLTPFVGKHPGGEAILKVCGVDGTKLFMNQHGGQAKQEDQLAGLEIGVLAK